MINICSSIAIAKRIRDIRKKMQLNQEDMKDKLYLSSRQSYANIENGKTNIKVEHIVALCEIFNCDVGYLFGEYETKHHVSSDVKEVTGLSEAAVEYLRKNNELYKKTKKLMKEKEENRKQAEYDYVKAVKKLKEANDIYKLKIGERADMILNNETNENNGILLNSVKGIVCSDSKAQFQNNSNANATMYRTERAAKDKVNSAVRVEKVAKGTLDIAIEEEANAKNNYSITGIKLHTLNFILEHDEEYGLLDLIGRYLFGIPIFRNDIVETVEFNQAISDDNTENNGTEHCLQKAYINYLYQFNFDNSTLPITDHISADEVYAALLVQLNNKLSELGKMFREKNKQNIQDALKQYLAENYDVEEIDYIETLCSK